ncbi:protein serine/threonine kinase, putative [Entamoeba invadens IP1]|uniref:Protein serine/threonine kinase, putative n=1 Tax=Entamoeba invadens IP1 TaxID=370355 RepID=L7FPA1_ENTIV|nr:protein serine/threonine kinase, putative [Entamoeba invadens IP1]ELP94573.1 protein serine/threonine kinase, putative [Entamoeba invadens IP1]|eukprot:XP_004261344.1 protein serine/threonine kinase, putative [Entamoeba invadens IP1]
MFMLFVNFNMLILILSLLLTLTTSRWCLVGNKIQCDCDTNNTNNKCLNIKEMQIIYDENISVLIFTLNNTKVTFLNTKQVFDNVNNSTFEINSNWVRQFNYFKTSSIKTDITCGSTLQPNCLECVSYNGNHCYRCEDGYQVANDDSIVKCYLLNDTDHTPVCGDSKLFKWSKNSQCTSTNCLLYNSTGFCTSCNQNYLLNDGKCYPKATNCATYHSNQYWCSQCNSGYFPYYYNCVPCGYMEGCTSCSQNHYKTCDSCSNGYYLKEEGYYKICKKCPSNCAYCNQDYNGNLKCSSCDGGYYMVNNDCISCGAGCKGCSTVSGQSGKTQCNECFDHYYNNENYVCTVCDSTCGNCNWGTGICTTCASGYVLKTTESTKCELCNNYESNCETCLEPNRQCYQCVSGMYPNTNKQCINCDLSCSMCSQTTGLCSVCASGYTKPVSDNQTCDSCSTAFPNCISCSQTLRQCQTCSTGFYPLQTSPYTCQQCHSSCANRCNSSTGYCTTCVSGYVPQLNQPSLTCELCSSFDTNCQTCATDGTRSCTLCKSTYYISDNKKCSKCDASCDYKCDGNTGYCTSCASNYVFSSLTSRVCQKCSEFDSNCVLCASNFSRKCLICNTGFYPNDSGKCVSCATNCTTCDSATGICTLCASENVFVDSPSRVCMFCKTFDNKCETCQNGGNRSCVTCTAGYYPGTTGQCISCDTTCQTNTCNTNNGLCTKCVQNYVVTSPTSKTCQRCSDFDSKCKTCATDFTRKCIECNTNYHPVNGRCVVCDSSCGGSCNGVTGVCTGCASNYVPTLLDPSKCEQCSTFDENCTTCAAGERQCSVCKSSKYPDEITGVCKNCSWTCNNNCDPSTGICTSCVLNYVFENPKSKVCIPCQIFDANCITCSSEKQRSCTICESNYYPKQGRCVPCDYGCTTCSSATGKCSACQPNFVPSTVNNTACVPCADFDNNCKTCATLFGRYCNECNDHFKPSVDGVCVSCDVSCDNNCDTIYGTCTTCFTNYVVTSPLSYKCDNCSVFDQYCDVCASGFSRKCVTCRGGKYPKDGVNCANCDSTCGNQCDGKNGHCTGCVTNYVLSATNSLQCESCVSFDANCQTCSPDFTRKCVTCVSGYFVFENKCKKCDDTCNNQCDSSTGLCTGCQNNMVFGDTNRSICVSCTAFDSNCYICDSSFNRGCNTCTNKHYVDSTTKKCIPCSSECDQCNGQTGACTNCMPNYVTSLTSGGCESCNKFDSNCKFCAQNQTRNCIQCNDTYYPVLTSGEMKCGLCDSTCGGKCDPTDGHCTGCQSNYVLYQTNNLKCQKCSDFDSNCFTCNSNYERKCTTCNTGYYPNADGKCISCETSCAPNMCNTSNGNCDKCTENKVITSPISNDCVDCTVFDSRCVTCSPSFARKCVKCVAGSYPQTAGDFRCKYCDATCGGKCDTTNGHCTGCNESYVPTTSDPFKCESCQTFDFNCATCVSDKRECAVCKPGKYPNDSNKVCQDCDSTCNGDCNTSSGICNMCSYNYVFNEPKGRSCVLCATFDRHCVTCASGYSRRCVKCSNGYYPDSNGKCVACSTIDSNCNTCNNTEKSCFGCKDPYHLSNQKCLSCEAGTYKKTETTCDKCYNAILNCKNCGTASVGTARCNECYPPYSLSSNGKSCDQCASTSYYDKTTNRCVNRNTTCSVQIESTKCVHCTDDYFVSNGKCKSAQNCNGPSSLSPASCDCSDQISINSDCASIAANCKYQKTMNSTSTCLVCKDNFTLSQNTCNKIESNELYKNGVKYSCLDGQYLSNNNVCEVCPNFASFCINNKNNTYTLKCTPNTVKDDGTEQCITDEMCLQYTHDYCSQCKSVSSQISNGICTACQTPNCRFCEGNKCKRCANDYLMVKENQCVSQSDKNCDKSSVSGCVMCSSGFYQVDSLNVEGKFDFCLPIPPSLYPNCKRLAFSTSKCVECNDLFKLKGGVCKESFEDEVPVVPSETEPELPVSVISNSHIEHSFNLKGVTESKCQMRDNKGCQRCYDGYYLQNNECVECTNDCNTCYSQTYCTSCQSGFYLDSKNRCQTLGDLSARCSVVLPKAGGCAICRDGYFKVLKDCIVCDISCSSCISNTSCSVCADGYFIIESESRLCQLNTTNTNCLKVGYYGCKVCADGYYLLNSRCTKCNETCTLCTLQGACTNCVSKDYVLYDSKCVHYSEITNCIEAKNSKCVKCKGYNKPSESGDSCIQTVNLGAAIGIPMSILLVMIIIFLLIVITLIVIFKRNQKKEKLKVCTYKMSRSNIKMSTLVDNIVVNKSKLKFDLDTDEFIPVDKETRDLICIGNTSKHNMKVQFSVIEGCDSYQIRTVPSIVTLKKGEACEFEIFIQPLCTCKIEESVMITSLDITTGNVVNAKIGIDTTTQQTTKLNYKELDVITKLGEGSFGIVYMGNYRGNFVAIKKMKQIASPNTLTNEITDEKKSLQEFENEVNMLDKFRSEFIVHFYGAVFIPNKVCMVTEYAQFGSLNDVLKQKKSTEVETKMRIIIILDGARGIQYLHENGILHRDIKPDNILIFSLDDNERVNAKLTDFGSSRNVNMLTTNMTFTKGIGTPSYMAPEILKKNHYKKPADIYSFAITMYECFGWCNAYSEKQFKFPWKIAEFVTNGKRLEKTNSMSNEQFDVIQKCWCTIPTERIEIGEVVTLVNGLINI